MGSLRLPTPYPGELIVSVLARAVIHNGLAPKRLLAQLVGVAGRSNYPAFLPTDLPSIAKQSRTDAAALLWNHTVFPYVVAFMPSDEATRFKEKVLGGCPPEKGSTASLVKSVTHALPEFRYCEQCALEDVGTRGESYWHRAHCLPGVYVCLIHNVLLRCSVARPSAFAQQLRMPLPQRQEGAGSAPTCPTDALVRVAQTTAAVCSDEWKHRGDWQRDYRRRAQELQLTRSNGQVAGARIAFELHELFGTNLLARAGCDFTGTRNPWPALMMREGTHVPFAPVKHILMDAYLHCTRQPSFSFSYRRPGKAPSSPPEVDESLAQLVEARAREALRKGEVLTLRDLFATTGKWEFFRHNRSAMPRTSAQVEVFKSSDAATRKSGGREAHARRLRKSINKSN